MVRWDEFEKMTGMSEHDTWNVLEVWEAYEEWAVSFEAPRDAFEKTHLSR